MNNETLAETFGVSIDAETKPDATLATDDARKLARGAVNVIRSMDPVAYKQYKAIKYKDDAATVESKQAAYEYALGALAALAIKAVASYSQKNVDASKAAKFSSVSAMIDAKTGFSSLGDELDADPDE